MEGSYTPHAERRQTIDKIRRDKLASMSISQLEMYRRNLNTRLATTTPDKENKVELYLDAIQVEIDARVDNLMR